MVITSRWQTTCLALMLVVADLGRTSYAFMPIAVNHFPLASTSTFASTTRSRSGSSPLLLHGSQAKPRFQLQMVSYEALMEKMPSQTVIKAADNAPNRKVTASDISASAGVSLSQARKDLTALASLTRGDIAVSNDGELIYSFPDNISSVLSSNSAKFRAIETFNSAKPVLFYALRVSFGVVLLASLAAIFSTIFFISQSSSSSDDNRRRDDRGFGGGGGMSPFGGRGGFGYGIWGPSPLDFFFYRPYYGYYSTVPSERQDPDEMGFLESTFSYIFGDGNPNQAIEEKRLTLAANMIRNNNGAVTAEQLAPFCDDAPKPDMGEENAYVDERFVLSIVTQLSGEPQVTEDGDIVYIFPDLQVSAASSVSSYLPRTDTSAMTLKRAGMGKDATAAEINTLLRINGISTRGALEKEDLIKLLEKALPPATRAEEAEVMGDDTSVLQEQEYQFSLAPDNNRFLAAGLGVVNLLGALYLGGQLNAYAMYGVKLPAAFGVVQSLYPLLFAYAILFNVIPVVRSFWIKQQNGQIQERNQRRRLWQTALSSGMGRVNRKLQSAKKLGTKMKKLGSKDIYFDTSNPIEEVEQKKQEDALDDFDKLLGN